MSGIIAQDKAAQIQDFQRKLNAEPNPQELDRTPDGKAKTLPISFVEMSLDELFFGHWGTRNLHSYVIGNEVVGNLTLWVIHPITGQEITREGAASIVIMVDKAPDDVKGQDKNRWALNPENKKPNALDMGFPKLKAECVKNAAQSLGKIFGRDLNRKKTDNYQPTLRVLSDNGFNALVDRIEKGDHTAKQLAESNFLLSDIQVEILKGLTVKQLNG